MSGNWKSLREEKTFNDLSRGGERSLYNYRPTGNDEAAKES